ncbi:MAG: Rrf2 family transcriptional regulator [bacterium]|jgi:Rrf2 family protein|nr:Rrf2 family transcriptional regulator [bacterium]
MKFSQSLDLALHSLMFIACESSDKPVMIKDLAKMLNASESYLARIMLWLAKSGILKSIRGKRGGFTFKIPPDKITIADVVVAIDTDAGQFECMGDDRHCNKSECAVVQLFAEARGEMLRVLRRMTIADMAAMRNASPLGCGALVPVSEIKAINTN